MEKIIKLIIDIDETDEFLCGNCFSKEVEYFSGSGPTGYKCRIFGISLKKENNTGILSNMEILTERCLDCLLITNTKKKFMAE